MKKSLLTLTCTISVLTLSCNKDKKAAQESYFKNTMPYSIYVDVHEPLFGNDILTSNMLLIDHLEVPANSTLDMKKYGLEAGKNYVYDWYSSDYKHTGWMRNNTVFSYTMFNYHSDLKIDISTDEDESNERLVCLSGDGKATIWKTVDAYDLNGNSVWNALGQWRNHTLSIHYHMSIVDSNWEGPAVCIPEGMKNSFTLSDTDRFWLQTDLYPDPDLILTDNADFIAPLQTTSTDTLFYIKRQRNYDNGGYSSYYRQPIYKIAKVRTEKTVTNYSDK